jgi:hypothetical protein
MTPMFSLCNHIGKMNSEQSCFRKMPDYSGHITHDEYLAVLQQELLERAKEVINDELGVVEGCALIHPLLCRFGVENDEIFFVIKHVESESQEFALGETRKLWSPTLLAKRDIELLERDDLHRSRVKSACREIINRLGDT